MSLAIGALAGCGGGGGGTSGIGSSTVTPTAPANPSVPTGQTTNVSTTVIDGPIKNAVVCLDKNGNGQCDADEITGTTDASGNVTLVVPTADVGKYALIAVIGKDAVDADHGPVPVAYTMSAPADRTGVVSPLTTLVQQTVASTGSSTDDAAKTVQTAANLSASPLQDYTKTTGASNGSTDAATVARLLVVTAQQQSTVVAPAVGASAIDGSKISQADLDKAVRRVLIDLLPSLVSALSDPAVQAATGAAKESALLAAAKTIVDASGLTPAAAPTVVAVNKAVDAPQPTAAAPFVDNITLANLSYTSATNYYARTLTFSAAQANPDAKDMRRFVERRLSNVDGALAKWGFGGSPARSADLHWNGTAWVGCPINFESTTKVRDAQGNGAANTCDGVGLETLKRATFDVGGMSMADFYGQARTAGYTNLFIADPTTLGSARFPAGTSAYYQSNSAYKTAISYYAGGANSPPSVSNLASYFSPEVAAGGTAAAQPAGVACNAAETNIGPFNSATTLEAWIATKTGTPCVYAQGNRAYNGMTYLSDAINEWWGNSTATIDKIGNAPLTPTATTTGYYTGNTLLRLAFVGTGTNPVTYYACKERLYDGSPRNCQKIGAGSYAIATLGDARVLTLTNPPALVASLTYDKLWVERAGFVHIGYQTKPAVTKAARLNTVGATALLQQLGVPVEDPETPLALTAGSYQGTWDIRHAGTPVSATSGTTLTLFANGATSCTDKATGLSSPCTLKITDPATGAFSYSDPTGSAGGTFSFMTGTASGTYSDPTATPATGSLVGGRR